MSSLWRFISLICYSLFSIIISKSFFGVLFPSANLEGAWFYAAIGYFLISLMTAPFFSKPTDTIATALTAGILLLSINIPSNLPGATALQLGKVVSILYCSFAIIVAIIAMLHKKRDSYQTESIRSKAIFRLSDWIGRGEIAFSFAFFISVFGFVSTRSNIVFVLIVFWIVSFLLKPHEILADIIQLWKDTRGKTKYGIGEVRAFENPRIAIVSLYKDKNIVPGTPIGIIDYSKNIKVGTALGVLELQEERWMRVLLNDKPISKQIAEEKLLLPKSWLEAHLAFALSESQVTFLKENSILLPLISESERPLIGFVAEDSSVKQIQIELISPYIDLYEGRLVTSSIKGKEVLYQVVDASTCSEALEKKSSLGYLRVRARKLGIWDSDERRFKSVRWLPEIHTPVFLRQDKPAGFQLDSVGYIPGSSFTVSLNPKLAVTHNTAILGVLGCGKTFLTLELIARFIDGGSKVICLDITGQYAQELSAQYDPKQDLAEDRRIQQTIDVNAENVSRNVEEGGNWQQFRDLIYQNIEQFIEDDSRKIRLYNPEGYTVWKQTGGLFQENAARATLTPVGVTRHISEGVLTAVSDSLSHEARVCIVFEEAHSLIPEWNSISFEGDRQASMGTAKAILQGRKYGLGCVVVTQRTANVIKSVLNQCNTIFAMRTFDATGMEFLANYIGKDFTNVLSVLEERTAVAYGRAISSDSPLIMKLNERSDFTDACGEWFDHEESDEENEVPF